MKIAILAPDLFPCGATEQLELWYVVDVDSCDGADHEPHIDAALAYAYGHHQTLECPSGSNCKPIPFDPYLPYSTCIDDEMAVLIVWDFGCKLDK